MHPSLLAPLQAFTRAFQPVVLEAEGVELRSPWLLPLADLVNFGREPNAGYLCE